MGVITYTPPSDRIIHSTAVDLGERWSLGTAVNLMQYDKTLPIIAVSLYSSGQPYTIPSSADLNVRVGKPDGTKVYNPVLGCNSARNVAYVEITRQISSVYGPALASLELIINGNVACSSYILLDIAKNPAPDNAIESTDEYKSLIEVIDEAKVAIGKPPIIKNEMWWLWDSEKKVYVNTDFPARGETGLQGKQGETGATGNGIASTILNDDYTLTIQFTDGTSYTTPSIRGLTGAQGQQGEKGDTGRGFTILGYYATASALSMAVPNPMAGDAYGIGTAAPYDIYIWDSTGHKWVNNGILQGAKGEQGIPGEQGAQGIQGPAGKDGKTPVAGVDYFTEADKTAMVNSVYALITNGDTASYGS